MQNVQFLFMATLIILLSCSDPQEKHSEKITSFITGTYVREFQGEYSVGLDTLIINHPDENTYFYTIRHNNSFQKIREKQLQPVEYKTETWTAIFDKKTYVLLEQNKGKQIIFLPDSNELMLGGSHFKKLLN